MAAGDREILKALEETTRRNVETAIAFGNETRKMVRELEQKVTLLESIVLSKNAEIQQLRGMLAQLQARVFAGGTTS